MALTRAQSRLLSAIFALSHREPIRIVVALLLPASAMLVAMTVWWMARYIVKFGSPRWLFLALYDHFPWDVLLDPPFASGRAAFFIALIPTGYAFSRLVPRHPFAYAFAAAALTGVAH